MRTVTDKRWSLFFGIILYLLIIYVEFSDGNENIILQFSEQNCSVTNINRMPTYKSDTIIISNCSLKILPNALFLSHTETISLSIFNTDLNVIEDFALNGLKQLEILSIHRNFLTEVSSWSQHDLVNLHTLDLRHNYIKTINPEAWQHYPNLETINLSINNLTNIENIFKYTPKLKNINLSKNRLYQIEGNTFKELSKLTHLSLEHNDIDFVDSFAFVNNIHLKSIRLDFNKIVIFDTLVLFNQPRLVYVNLSHNALTAINEYTFKRNFELKILDISFNRIVDFEKNSFSGLVSLEIFNASNNFLENLNPNVFHDSTNLKLFDASSNKLTYLFDGSLEYLSNIEHINLSHNSIDEIQSNVFSGRKSLQTIDLSNNMLSNENFFDEMTELKTLIMSYNKFEYLNLSKLLNIQEIYLIGNPWNCTWLIMEMMRHSNGVHFGKNFSIETEEQVLTVPGIDCIDQDGNNRSIVMLQQSNNKIMDEIVNETPVYEQQNKLLKRMLEDEFGFKACLIWTTIAVIVVFGAVHIGRVFLKKSEVRSERFRLSQQVSLITTATTPTTANSDKFSESKLIHR